MTAIMWLVGVGVAVAAASQLFKILRIQKLPDTSDEVFLSLYEENYGTRSAHVLRQREFIAKHLGLPAQKLTPDQKFRDLSRYTGFAAEYEVGMGDLEDELGELRKRAGMERPSAFPETVGQLIDEILKAKG